VAAFKKHSAIPTRAVYPQSVMLYRQGRLFALVCGGAWLVGACSETANLAPTLSEVSPSVVSRSADTRAVVFGRNLYKSIEVDLSGDSPPSIGDDFALQIDGTPMRPSDLGVIDSQSMDFVIPAGLSVGSHSVEVTIPDGRSASLSNAFTVVDCPDGGTSCGMVEEADAGPSTGTQNLVATSNGGVLDRFTSEYCAPAALPANCMPGYWDHRNINDGEYAMGYVADAFRASWASGNKFGVAAPEEFVFSFAGGADATITQIVIQNYGEEGGAGPYYATHIVVAGEPIGGGAFFTILDEDIAANEDVVVFDLAGPVDLRRIQLSITSSVASDYWELGEFEAWGQLH
jgi:hypothetical protein